MGCSKLSKVVGFAILLTLKALISSLERKPKSTAPTTDETGCDMFILAISRSRHQLCKVQARAEVMK